jgi:hypothetical protein
VSHLLSLQVWIVASVALKRAIRKPAPPYRHGDPIASHWCNTPLARDASDAAMSNTITVAAPGSVMPVKGDMRSTAHSRHDRDGFGGNAPTSDSIAV